MPHQTKIGITIGPSCEQPKILEKMLAAGMDFTRLNFAHGTHASHGAYIKTVRALEKKSGRAIAIVQDLEGPRIRVGLLPENGVPVEKGEKVVLNAALTAYRKPELPLDHREVPKFVHPGERLLIAD